MERLCFLFGHKMLVHFVTDEPNKIPAIRAMLEPQHAVESHLLGATDGQALSDGVLVVDADLRNAVPVEQVKVVLRDPRCVSFRTISATRLRKRSPSALPPWLLGQATSYRNWPGSRWRRRQ